MKYIALRLFFSLRCRSNFATQLSDAKVLGKLAGTMMLMNCSPGRSFVTDGGLDGLKLATLPAQYVGLGVAAARHLAFNAASASGTLQAAPFAALAVPASEVVTGVFARKGLPNGVTLPFIAGEEEDLVFFDRSANRAAVLLERHLRLGARSGAPFGDLIEEIARIKRCLAAESVRRAVQRIRARLDSDIDYRAGLPAIFRPGIFLDIELLDGVNRQNRSRIALRAPGRS